MRKFLLVSGLVSCCMLSGCIAQALTSGRVEFSDDSAAATPHFSARDRQLIRDYYSAGGRSRVSDAEERSRRGQSGDALERGEKIRAGAAERSLPSELESRLTPLSEPYRRAVIGSNLVLFNRRTRIVVDIVRGIAE